MERIASRCVCCGSANLTRSGAVLMPFVAYRAFGWTPVEITPDWGLRTIQSGMAYPLCNSLQCQDCGLVFLDIRFDAAEMSGLYRGYRGADYTADRERFEPGYAALNAAIIDHVPDTSQAETFLGPHVGRRPRVLDWGGDTGDNTPFLKTALAIDIFDISDQPVIEGARRVSREDLQGAAYDLVVLSHVLEHVPEPVELVRDAAAMLGPEAILYVEVPYEGLIAADPDSRDLAVRKKYWHEHINFFTEDAMRALLARAGLEVAELETRAMTSLANVTQVLAVACRKAS
jgi:SAM-dependent methyltransferase